jgi:uncharacterized membrane protein YeaQ/YmgE (transglycosylase-associated protein family)
MGQAELSEAAAIWANQLLSWVGFGTLVGLLAKAIMPGRDPGGAVVTLLMGMGGSIIGCGVLMFFWPGHRISPVSPMGFLVGIGGAFFLLAFYRMLGGRFFTEGVDGRYHFRRSYRRTGRRVIALDDDHLI